MEFIEVMKIKKRMCEKYKDKYADCIGRRCPLSARQTKDIYTCYRFICEFPEKTEQILKKWDEEHPQKCFLSDFLEKFPNAPLKEDGTPKNVCPCDLGYVKVKKGVNNCELKDLEHVDCVKCWDRPL